MKITLSSPEELASVAARIARLVGRPAVPVLAGALLVAEDDTLSVTGFNHEVALTRHLAAEVGEPGRILVSARLLSEVAKALPRQAVTLTAEEQQVTITCGPVTARLPLMPVEDYPPLPAWPQTGTDVDGSALSAALSAVDHARAGAELAELCGVHLLLDSGELWLLTADRARFAQATVPLARSAAGLPQRLRVEHAPVAEAAKQARGRTVRLAADEAVLGLATEQEWVLVRQMTAETAPPFHKARNQVHGTPATISCAELSGLARRCRVYGDKVTAAITAEPGLLTVITVGGEHGGGEERLDLADYTGPATTFGMNPVNLEAAVNALDAERATVILPDAPHRAMQLVPLDADGVARGDQVQILAPKKLAAAQ